LSPLYLFARFKIEELLGWDLDDKDVHQLREAKKDREGGNKDAYTDLDSI